MSEMIRFWQGLTMGLIFGMMIGIFCSNIDVPKYENVEEIITLKASDILTFPKEANLFCESGADIREYNNEKVIYGCMRVVPIDGGAHVDCSGNNKKCYVNYKKLVEE